MKLSELIAEYGDDKVSFQVLSTCQCGNVTKIEGGYCYSFVSTETPGDVVLTGKREALIVWMDASEMKRIIKEAQAKEKQGG